MDTDMQTTMRGSEGIHRPTRDYFIESFTQVWQPEGRFRSSPY
jgi:hypothetical protein